MSIGVDFTPAPIPASRPAKNAIVKLHSGPRAARYQHSSILRSALRFKPAGGRPKSARKQSEGALWPAAAPAGRGRRAPRLPAGRLHPPGLRAGAPWRARKSRRGHRLSGGPQRRSPARTKKPPGYARGRGARGVYSPTLMGIRLARAVSTLGMTRRSTPFLNSAFTSSALISTGRVKLRTKVPWGISWR